MEFIEENFGPVKVYHLGGKIMGDAKTQEMCNRIKTLLKTGAPALVMDFQRVRWINSSGVGAMLACLNMLRQNGGDIRFANLQGMTQQYFHLSKLETVVSIFASVEKAVASFTEPVEQSAKQ